MEDQHHFLGIDLGTTNSVVSWGRFVRRINMFQPEIIPVEFLDKGKKAERKDLLPSVVFFEEGMTPVVGEYARLDAFGKQPHLVVKSVKSRMGSGEMVPIGKREFSPAYISSLILNQLRAATKDKFGIEESDVIITVPASFDADMRADTIEAAERAGFKTKNTDGSTRDMLLDEPRAALHFLVYKQQIDDLDPGLIDFSTPKTILIFDLGGGTLDVSLHKVQADYDRLDINVEDLAISRYTRIGGDNFDQLIAQFFASDFENKFKLKIDEIPEDYIRHSILSQLLLEAEAKKREINDIFTQGLKQKATLEMLRPRVYAKVFIPGLYDDKAYSHPRFTWDEMEEIISPLLGYGLTLKSVDSFDELGKDSSNNIIYPILDVLNKTKIRNNGVLPAIDAVFLNGGMTRFIPVRKRIEDFFELKAITDLDPDKSVALGASLYHYALHQGIRPKNVILAESIGIEVNGNIVKHLVRAGTVLPMPRASKVDGLTIPAGTSELTIPFYRGEGDSPEFPNVKVLERMIKLPTVSRKSESLEAQVIVDANKVLTFRATLKSNPAIKIEVEVQSSGVEVKLDQQTHSRNQVSNNYSTAVSVPFGPEIDVEKTLESLFNFQYDSEKTLKNSLEKEILQSKNGHAFIEPISNHLNELCIYDLQSKPINHRRAILLLGSLVKIYPENRGNGLALSVLIKLSSYRVNENFRRHFMPMIISAVGRMQNPGSEDILLTLIQEPNMLGMRDILLVALSKVSRSANAIAASSQYLDDPNLQVRKFAAWSLGKMGRRDYASPASVNQILPSIEKLSSSIMQEQNVDALRMMIYAIGELCDQRSKSSDCCIPRDMAKALIVKLRQVYNTFERSTPLSKNNHLMGMITMVEDMLNGKSLGVEEEKVLLVLRSKLDDDGMGD